MKKLFFFRSSGNSNQVPQPATDKKVAWEKPSGSKMNNQDSSQPAHSSHSSNGTKSGKRVADIQGSVLRRSRSLSSAAFLVDGPGETFSSNPNGSPCSTTSNGRHRQHDHSSRPRCLTPERQPRGRQFYGDYSHISEVMTGHESSASSSSCSSNVSSKVVDRYIDGEEHLESSKQKNSSSHGSISGKGNSCRKLPPRYQCTAPTSPSDSAKEKKKSHSFREVKGSRLHFCSTDSVDNSVGNGSPRTLARNVIERLSRAHGTSRSKDLDHEPITIQDVYGGSLNTVFESKPDASISRMESLDDHCGSVNEYPEDEVDQDCLGGKNNCKSYHLVGAEEDTDLALDRRLKEAKKKIMLLSEELEQQSFLSNCGADLSSLVQAVRKLEEEKIYLVYEITSLLQARINDRASAKEDIHLLKAETELHTRRLEKEKNELQVGLEKELDRRSSDWSLKLDKNQLEEKRLRERVRELAEQNVSLQREISSFHERESENRTMIEYSDRKIEDVTGKLEEACEENKVLRQTLSELQERYAGAVEKFDCMRRNYDEKDKESRELQKSVSRLLRTCKEQEKTIEGLRVGLSNEQTKKQPTEKLDQLVKKLEMEQIRLSGVELSLRREVEARRHEADSIRHENICLLNRLKGNGREVEALTVKLDTEMGTRVNRLQDQGLSMLNESTQLCFKLLKFIKEKGSQFPETHQSIESTNNGLDEQFLIETEMKVQGFRRGAESLSRSLRTMSTLFSEKSDLVASLSQFPCTNATARKEPKDQTPEDARDELKAETLVTNLLREKLYSKEQEVEQLQAELATAVRGNDILRCEVQNALDDRSSTTHRLKDLEVQILKKDDAVTRLQMDLQETRKELGAMKGLLPRVSEERDMIWQELNQYREKNMLLNSEVGSLKKKMEALDEDILLKEGQIAILKDSIGSKDFNLLDSPEFSKDFLVQ